MTIKEKLEAIKTLTLCADDVDEYITNLARHIADEVTVDIGKQVTDISVRVNNIKGRCQTRLPEKHAKTIADLVIKTLNDNGYYAEYHTLDRYYSSKCVYIIAAVSHKLKNKPDIDKNETLIKEVHKIRETLVENAVLNHMADITKAFDYGLKNIIISDETDITFNIKETDVRLLNKYIAADIENYIDIAMNTVNKFCNKNGIVITNIKNYDNTLVIADITIEI